MVRVMGEKHFGNHILIKDILTRANKLNKRIKLHNNVAC